MNTSATGGPLPATPSPAPLEGQALLDFLQAWFVGILGIDGKLVRPRWQAEPGTLPGANVDWVAFGITRRESDVNAAELHFPSGQGYNEIRRHETLNILISFYGPNADLQAHLLREGMQVAQNRETLQLASMGLVETGDVIAAPELVKDKWYQRLDMSVRIRRQIKRQYAVLTLESAQIQLDNEKYTTPINVQGA